MCNSAVNTLLFGTSVGGTQAAYEQGRDQQKIEDENAKLALQEAADASRRGAIEEENHRNRVRAMLGAQRASFGANNVDSASGTPLGLLTETARFGEVDAVTIRNNAAREVYGYKHEAKQSKRRGRMYRNAGNQNAASTALTSGSNAYGSFLGGGA